MDISNKIADMIKKAIDDLGINIGTLEVIVETPKDQSKGDYASNIAMRLSSQLKRNPIEIAQNIMSKIPEDKDILSINVAPPGFINFSLSNTYFLTQLSRIVEGDGRYFKTDIKTGTKVVVEYTDANPFKELHIGHLYSNAVGEAFSRLQEVLDAEVKRACYQGDIGLHVAKSLWGLEKMLEQDTLTMQDLEQKDLEERVKYIGKAYVYGAGKYEEEEPQKEIDELNIYIFSLFSDSVISENALIYEERKIKEMYEKGKKWCLDFFELIYEKVGTKFDAHFFESEVGDKGLDIVMKNIGKVFEEDDGAIIYKGDKKKHLHTRVFVNSHGIPTYEAKEIGLAVTKDRLLDCDESVVITADEQSGYFKVVMDALGKIYPEIQLKTKHFAHGKVKLPGSVKMSSRRGGILSAEWLISETKSRVEDLMKENDRIPTYLVSEISEKIAIGAIKYAFLKVNIGRDIVFDFDKNISFDGDTGPYLMYVYSRCRSILEGSKSVDIKNVCIDSCLENPYTKELVRVIGKSRSALLDSATMYSPSTLCQYLFDLGQAFSSFYQNVRVLDAQEDEKQMLLLIVKATMLIMQYGLSVLAIPVVEEM